MADDYTTAEIVRRLSSIEQTLRELGLRVVSVDLYTRDRTEIERRLAEIERDIAEERLARKEAAKNEAEAREKADRDLKTAIDGQGSNWRQAIYAGVIPGVLVLIGILLQLKGGK